MKFDAADPEVEKRLKFAIFKEMNKARLEMWMKAHLKKDGSFIAPPIRWDERIKDYVWLNREERRKLDKQPNNGSRIIRPNSGEREAPQTDLSSQGEEQTPRREDQETGS